MSGRFLVRRSVLAAAVLLAFSEGASAQTVEDQARKIAKSEDLGHSFTMLGVLGSTPGASGGHLDSDMNIGTMKLPFAHSFGKWADTQEPQIRLRTELTLSHVTARQTVELSGAADSVALKFKSWTALAGVGADIRITPTLNLRPLLLAGYSRTTGNARTNGPIGDLLLDATEGILDNMRLENASFGGAMELAYDRTAKSGLRVRGTARYNLLADVPAKQSDESLRSKGTFSVATLNGELSGPLPARLFDRNLRWLAFAKGLAFIGERNDALGFKRYGELGAGVELLRPLGSRPIKGITLYGSLIRGGNVKGWTLGLGLDF